MSAVENTDTKGGNPVAKCKFSKLDYLLKPFWKWIFGNGSFLEMDAFWKWIIQSFATNTYRNVAKICYINCCYDDGTDEI